MTGVEFQEKMRCGAPLFGSLITSPSPKMVQEIDKAGLDFVFIDTEHIALDREKLSFMCQAYAGKGLPAIVRVLEPDPFLACMALDAGACGVMGPYIETEAQVRALHGAVKLRPLKGDKLRRALDGEPLDPATDKYLREWNKGRLLILNIESTAAIGRLESLIAAGDTDGVIVGPHDLSISLGVPEDYDHPRFFDAVASIVKTARKAGVGAGNHYSFGTKAMAEWGKLGMNIMLYSSDVTHFVQGAQMCVAEIKKGMA